MEEKVYVLNCYDYIENEHWCKVFKSLYDAQGKMIEQVEREIEGMFLCHNFDCYKTKIENTKASIYDATDDEAAWIWWISEAEIE